MAEKHQVDKSIDELVDIRDVKLDSSLGQAERIQSFLQQIKNPYCFRVGDVVVNVAYTEGASGVQNKFATIRFERDDVLIDFYNIYSDESSEGHLCQSMRLSLK